MNTPTLETERLLLRRFTEADIDALYALLRDEEVNTFLPWFPAECVEDARRFYEERYAAVYARPRGYAYAVCLKAGGGPIGYIKVEMDDSYDFGYALQRPFWGQGLVTEAGRAVVERVRADGLPYITATHDVNNPRQRRRDAAAGDEVLLFLQGAVGSPKTSPSFSGCISFISTGRTTASIPNTGSCTKTLLRSRIACSKPRRRQDTGRRNLSAALRAVCVQTGGYRPTLCGFRRTPFRGPRRKPLPSALRRRRRAGSSVLFREIPLLCAAVRRNPFRRTCFMRLPLCAEEGKLRRLAMYPSVRPAPDRCSYPACGAGLRRPHIVSLQSLCSVLWIWREYSPSAAFDNLHAMRASKKADNRRFHQIAAEIYVQNADCNLTK